MSFLVWLKNISWRTLYAFVPVLAQPDDDFARRHLNSKAYGLYLSMDKRDRAHACEVAKAVLTELEPSRQLVAAAFLHDIGKAEGRYNALERILVHLYCPTALPKSPRLKGLSGVWQRRLHHAYYGAQKIREAGLAEDLALIVEYHHQPEANQEAARLKRIEDRF